MEKEKTGEMGVQESALLSAADTNLPKYVLQKDVPQSLFGTFVHNRYIKFHFLHKSEHINTRNKIDALLIRNKTPWLYVNSLQIKATNIQKCCMLYVHSQCVCQVN